jgi:hypothetical protein
MRMTKEAERAWQLFLDEVRDTAPPDVDADDLVETLASHLDRDGADDAMLGVREVDRLIVDLRRDLLAELEGEGGARPASSAALKPDLVNLGLFAVTILASPFVTPVPLFASWIWSRYLIWKGPHSPLDALPATVFASALLVGIPLGSGFALATMLAELRPGPAPGWFLLACGIALLMFAALIVLRLWAEPFFRAIFAPLDRFGSRRMLRRLLVSAAAAGFLATAGSALLLANFP